MDRETIEQRLIRNVSKDPRDYHIMVGSKSIMLLPIDPKRQGVADLLYIFDSERYPEGIEILVHAHNELERIDMTFNTDKE